MWGYICLIAGYLKWAWDFLLSYSFFQSHHHHLGLLPQIGEELSLHCYEGNIIQAASSSDCAVCLCKIEEGEEVPQLRCNHVFHGECLDRWLGYNHATCPLCRHLLLPPMLRAITELGVELLEFKFCYFGSGGHRDTWWLR